MILRASTRAQDKLRHSQLESVCITYTKNKGIDESLTMRPRDREADFDR